MKLLVIIIISTITLSKSFAQEIPVIKSKEVDKEDYRYATSLEKYQEAYEWRLWSFPFRKSNKGMQVPSADSLSKPIYLINDSDLKTSWSSEDSTKGLGKKIDIIINFDPFGFYSTAYQFYGVINVFNGNCESLASWTEYSRIKTLNFYFNDSLVCKVELVDTWHFQDFDISRFFKNKYWGKYLDAKYEIKEGDKLTFEIMEIYPGTKYKQVALSEFLIRGASN